MATTTRRVPDEVWAAVPERRLPRLQVIAALLAVLLLAWLGVVLARSGWVTPNIAVGATSGSSYDMGTGRFAYETQLTNDGDTDATLSDVSLTAPWLTLVSARYEDAPTDLSAPFASGSSRATLAPGRSTYLRLDVRVDCAKVDRAGSRILVTAASPWRATTLDVAPSESSSHLPGFTGDDGSATAWPFQTATAACTPLGTA